MLTTRAIALGAVLLAAATGPSVAPPPDNDAGSGKDAGDTWALALGLPSAGTYRGGLRSSSDVDWYRLASSGGEPVCAMALFKADASMAALRAETPAGDLEVATAPPKGKLSAMSLATRAPSALDLALGNGAEPQGPLYDFDLRPFSHATAPVREGAVDAPSGTTGAAKVPAACIAGTLRPGAGDSVDTFAFKLTKASRVAVSIASVGPSSLQVRLATSSGQVVAATGPGHVVWGELPAGTSYLTVQALGGAESGGRLGGSPLDAEAGDDRYLVGATSEQATEPPPPCSPFCLSTN